MGLVGRERELAELTAAFDAAVAGRGNLVLLAGEAGIGKTTLAHAFAAAAAGRGARLAWGRAWEAGGAPAFWPWVEVLRVLVGDGGEAAVAGSLAVAAEIVPELAGPDLPRPPELAPAQARFRLFDAVGALLRWSARGGPVVIVLDDLHAADPATLSLLQFAVRAVARSPVLLIGTAREVEARLAPEIASELARVARESRYLVLPRLGPDEVAAWLAAAGDDGGGRLADLLYQRTEGNPLFLVETYRLLRADPRRGTAALPDGVRDVIAARVRALPDGCRRLLEGAAALGRSVDLGLLAMMESSSVDAVSAGLAEAVRAEVVAEAAPDRVVFTHILIREVIEGALAADRRAALHRAAARALEARDASDPAAPLTDLVHHLFAAGAPDAVAWARRAAERAAHRLAFEDGVGFLERALAALPAGEDSRDRCDLLLELAAARIRAGLGAGGRAAARRAADIARRLGEPELLARAALRYGDVFVFAEVDPVLIDLLEEALAGLPAGDSELRARVLARLAAARQPAPDPEEPMRIARDAIAMADRVAGPATRLDVVQAASSAMLYFAEPAERVRLNRQLAELARGAGEPARVLRAHVRLVFDHLELNDPAAADAAIAACEGLARELSHPAYLWQTPLLRAMRAVMQGRFGEAEELAARARALAEKVDDPNRALALAGQRLGLLLGAARHDALEAEAADLVAVVYRAVDLYYAASFAAMVWARLGRLDRVRAELSRLPGDSGWARGRMMAGWVAEAAAALGDAALAADLIDVLRPLAGRNLSWGVGSFVTEDSLARSLGIALSVAGRHDEA
ncbi:MAG TPA: AAA family ATPase, partial [Kofleriaceae bacterium]|nr:AAA family ATPase [Kofleriaceae bacterium]